MDTAARNPHTKAFSMKTHLYPMVAALLCAVFAAGCNDTRKDVEVLGTGLVSVNGQEIVLTENTDTANPLWLVAGDRAGEAMGSLITRSDGSTLATITGAVYVTPQGEGFTVTLNEQGYPGTIACTDGSVMELTNYTPATVDVQLTPAGGAALPVQTVAIDERFSELQALIDENGLVVDTAAGDAIPDMVLKKIGLADYASDARTRRTVIKITGTALSVAGCVGALFISELAPPVAFITCTSAYAGLVSTVEYLTDTRVFEGDDTAGGVSFMLSAAACAGLSLPDCASTLLSIADAAIAECIPAQEQFVKRCYNGNVYWFNDCGARAEPAEECACGCENGACIPIEACTEPLAITVSAQAAPACAATGENIFFSSTVSGGDAASYVYSWDFGDGATGVLDADSHSYATAGRKTVALTVSDSQGNYGFAAIPVQIEDCEQFLETEITSVPDCTDRLEAVPFGSRVRGGDGNYSYFWTFGDGATSTAASPSHRYASDGRYLVTLTVTDALGNRALDAAGIQIGDCPVTISVAIEAYATCIEPGESLIFSANVSGTNPFTALYAWDFGDGSTSTESQAVSHTFTIEGTYTVIVTVTDSAGNSGTGAYSVQVGNCTPSTTTTTADSGGDAALVAQCNALDYISVSTDPPEYSEYSAGTCSSCTSKIRVRYTGPDDISGVRMMYKNPTISYGPWLWKGMGPLPDVYEWEQGVGTSCCDGKECDANDITRIGAVFYDSACNDILDDPESYPLPLLEVDQPCRGYSR